jgi:predicted metal-dependent enzyme (double-stranded beta helix superfamily)
MHHHFRKFIDTTAAIVSAADGDEARILGPLRRSAAQLVARDDWLDPAATVPHPSHYQQYLLYRDPDGHFTVVSFVWGPGQATPIHDHKTWGVIAMLRGAEISERFVMDASTGMLRAAGASTLHPGDIDAVSPALGDIHRVRNAFDDRVSISIHIYGGDIGSVRRETYDQATGQRKTFVSGYAHAAIATVVKTRSAPYPASP